MKLQLKTAAQVQHFADMVSADDREACALNIIQAFSAEDHDPFTRKDFNAILDRHGFETDWETLDPVFYGLIKSHAHKAQKPDGSNRRGYYTFKTPQPKSEIDELLENFDPGAPKDVDPVGTLLDEQPAPRVIVETADGEAWVPSPPANTVAGYYETDIGLRRTAVAESKCYGNWTPGTTPCDICPLAAFCQPASMADLSQIAKALDAETVQAIRDANRPPVTEPTPVPDAPKTPDEKPTTGEYPEGAHEMTVPFEGICTKCGKGIAENDTGVHVPGQGMLHPDCARQ